ncbi:IS200/IS605 family transposase [Terasakiella sp. SH-1]|uniref:IS200/IS605 family transposase n=1 Tax=Terasakiella sp. SH-1 TaxID=2560057 RepID=UPI00107320C9|nr:IS200/IS605 family transposase [Terasakiella sp. SH-1]
MPQYRKASHVTYDCRYHIIWITKYRRKILTPQIHQRLKTIIQGITKELYINTISLGMEDDHIHLYASIPITQPIPYVVQKLKGRTSHIIRQEFKTYLKPYYWKPVLWATGYFVATVGEVSHDIIKNYVDNQGKQDVLGNDETIEL